MRSALVAFIICSSVSAWKTFIVPHAAGQDDTPVLTAALGSGNYSSNATILFERGVTYNIFSPIEFPILDNVEVAIEGNLTYPTDISVVQGTLFHSHS